MKYDIINHGGGLRRRESNKTVDLGRFVVTDKTGWISRWLEIKLKRKGDIEEIVPNVYYLPMNSSGVQSIIRQATQPWDDRGGAAREPKEMMIQTTVFFTQDGSLGYQRKLKVAQGMEQDCSNVPNVSHTVYKPLVSVLISDASLKGKHPCINYNMALLIVSES